MHVSEKWKWSRSVVSNSSDPVDYSLPGSSVHGIFQAKVLEWGAIAFSDGPYSPWNSLRQNTGVGSLSLLQGIFPTQGSNPGLLHCRQILYQLSHKGTPRKLKWKKKRKRKLEWSLSLQQIFPIQELNRGLLYCRILYQLSYQGSPKGKLLKRVDICKYLIYSLCCTAEADTKL